jgi:hypothetical protein
MEYQFNQQNMRPATTLSGYPQLDDGSGPQELQMQFP